MALFEIAYIITVCVIPNIRNAKHNFPEDMVFWHRKLVFQHLLEMSKEKIWQADQICTVSRYVWYEMAAAYCCAVRCVDRGGEETVFGASSRYFARYWRWYDRYSEKLPKSALPACLSIKIPKGLPGWNNVWWRFGLFSWTAVNAYGKTTFLTLDFVDIKDNVLEITVRQIFGYMRMIIKFCLRIKWNRVLSDILSTTISNKTWFVRRLWWR